MPKELVTSRSSDRSPPQVRWITKARPILCMALAIVMSAIGAVAGGSIPESSQIWTARYNGSTNLEDSPTAMVMSPDGSRLFVTGETVGPGGLNNYATIAYSTSGGAQLWVSGYNGPGVGGDSPSSIAISPDSSMVFVTGGSQGSGSGTDYATIAYSASSGEQLWIARYNGPGNSSDAASSIATSPAGSQVLVTGLSFGAGIQIPGGSFSYLDYATVAYSAATGAELWVARYSGPSGDHDSARSIALSPDGSTVFVTGGSKDVGSLSNYDYATVAYSAATGTQLWLARYNGPINRDDFAVSLAVSPDGSRVFVTGNSFVSGITSDYATIAYSAVSGEQLWVRTYNGPGNGPDGALSVVVSPDNTAVFVTGASTGRTGTSSGPFYDYATLAYSSATGAQLWVSRYDSPTGLDDVATSLAISPDGSRVFVTGGSGGTIFAAGLLEEDYATIAYSASSGAELWVARYNGTGNLDDTARSIALSPDGSRIFVTGRSNGCLCSAYWAVSSFGSSYDFATVSYAATTTCTSGQNETGTLSGTVKETVEPQSGPAAPYVHGVNCDVVVPAGL